MWPVAFSLPILLLCGAIVHSAEARRAMVATVHPLATRAGLEAIERGGNAVDAAVAAALMLGVVDGHNSGLGGGCFILARLGDGRLVAIDGRETAPAAARPDLYRKAGVASAELSQRGPLAVAIPGALAAYEQAVTCYGQLSLAELLDPCAAVAEQGFAIDRIYARNLRETADLLLEDAAARQTLLHPDGSPLGEGDILRQPDLATTYRAIAGHGSDWFYRGPFAATVAAWMQQHGGVITASDFAAYRAVERQPVVTTYRGLTIVGFPPPSSGGIHVAQILNIVENFDLAAEYRADPVRFVHRVAEAMKLAFADRAYWLGDADFVSVPRGLIDKAYARKHAARIDPEAPLDVKDHGLPPNWQTDLFGHHTTHIAAADAQGNWVALTATINMSFGAKIIVPGTGVILNNEMDDFSIDPGRPNAFGLIGAENNAVAPGKRPLSSMSPTIVLKDGRPVLTLGAAGGPKIISQVALTIIRCTDLKLPLPKGLAAPRFHHQWRPNTLFVEPSWPDEFVNRLRQRGHTVRPLPTAGVTQAIGLSDAGDRFLGVSDPRVPGLAAGLD